MIGKLEKGMYLSTKDGQHRSNAVVLGISERIVVLTDFGNIIQFDTEKDVDYYYEISNNWLESKSINYPLPPLPERIQEQIALLQKALDYLEE